MTKIELLIKKNLPKKKKPISKYDMYCRMLKAFLLRSEIRYSFLLNLVWEVLDSLLIRQ